MLFCLILNPAPEDATYENVRNVEPKNPIYNSQDTSLNEHLVNRWSSYATKGLPKELREGLAARWPVASNCPYLKPSKINPEVEVLLNHSDKKDGFLGTLQEKISRSLTAVGAVIQDLGSNQQLPDARLSQSVRVRPVSYRDFLFNITAPKTPIASQVIDNVTSRLSDYSR